MVLNVLLFQIPGNGGEGSSEYDTETKDDEEGGSSENEEFIGEVRFLF